MPSLSFKSLFPPFSRPTSTQNSPVLAYISQQQEDFFLSLRQRYGSPLFILDVARLAESYAQLTSYLPNVQLYYALKSLCHGAVAKKLVSLGCFLDFATAGEVQIIQDAAVLNAPSIYTHPYKRSSDIEAMLAYGCHRFVYDSLSELEKLLPYKDRIKLFLRLGFPNSSSMVNLSSKFGCLPNEATAYVQTAMDMGFNVCGLSFHVGSQSTNPAQYVKAITACIDVMKNMPQVPFEFLDIGGGFPVVYPFSPPIDFDSFFAHIRKALEGLPSSVYAIAEPGRFLSAPAGYSIASVMGYSYRDNTRCYYLDDGVYGNYSGLLFDGARYFLNFPNAFKDNQVYKSHVFGPTCDSVDAIGKDIMLPELPLNSMVVGSMMGAYTYASATTFNGFEKSTVVVVDGTDILSVTPACSVES